MFSQGYLIDSQLCVVALWLFYFALLHRRVPLTAARVYLLLLCPVGMLLPLLRIPLLPAPQTIIETIPISDLSQVVVPAPPVDRTVPVWLLLYIAGVVVCGTIVLAGIVRTWLAIRKTKRGSVSFSPTVAGAYSAFGRIFVNDKFEGSPLLDQILAHEQSHIAYRHSLDLLWTTLWRSLLWFNPAVWHAGKLLREVHEFQADRAVIRKGNPVGPYIDLLIGTEAGIYPAAANALCYSLTKKRLKMIARATRRTSVGGYLRLAALPGFIGAMLCAFSLTTKAATPLSSPAVAPMVPTDTLRQTELTSESIQKAHFQTAKVYSDGQKLDPIDLDVRQTELTSESIQKAHLQTAKVYSDGQKLNHIDLDVRTDPVAGKYTATIHNGIPPYVIGDKVSNEQPIYVIDDKIYDATSSVPKEVLNTRNIESISILKGNTATRFYGEKGRNGVIVITTKKTDNLRKGLAISSGEIHESQPNGQSRLVGRSGSFDPETVKKVTVALSRKEKRKGITVSSKLLKDYPDLFELGPDGSVQNRIPVSVTINEEK